MLETDLTDARSSLAVEITFPAGLPGFPHLRRFQLAAWRSDDTPFLLLSAIDDADVGFVVVPPWAFYPDYAVVLDDEDEVRLGLTSADDALVLSIVNFGRTAREATLNLVGPIVVNRVTLEAAQVAVHLPADCLRAPLAVAS